VAETLRLHDASLLSFKKSGKNYVMLARRDGFCRSNISFLYHEIYRTDTGYEAHMMFWVPKGLAYLTIACADISFEDGVLFEG
jgi:hypothetical protein